VDCEGIDAFDQTLDYSTQVFSLGVLLSSMLIYNQMGSIDESSVDKLSCVCEFAKRIKSKAGAADEQELRALSPSFLWLLRDTYLTLDSGMATPKDYMEEVLRAGGDAGKDQTRASIKDVFPSRDCFAMKRPLTEESELAAMDQIPLSRLRPDFQQGLEKLISNVLSNATPKQFRGSYINGGALASFAQAFVRVINEGGVPSLSSTWQAVIEAENRQAMDAGLEVYNAHLAPATTPAAAKAPGCVEALEAAHLAALEAGILAYRQKAMGVAPQQAMESEAKLRAAMESRYQPLMVARVAEADMHAREMLSVRALRLAELLGKEPLDADALHVQLGHMLVDYNAQASGPNKYKLAVEFMVNDVARPVADAAARATQNAKDASMRADATAKELMEANAKLTGLQHQIGTAQQDATLVKQQLAASQADFAQAKEAANQYQIALAKAEASKDQTAHEVTQMRARVEQLQEQLSSAKAEAAAKAAEVVHKTQQLEAATRAEKQASAAVQAMQTSGQGREEGLRNEVNRLNAELHMSQSQLIGKGQEIAQLNQQLQDAMQSKQQVDVALSQLQAERSALMENLTQAQTEQGALVGRLTQAQGECESLMGRLTQAQGERESLMGRLTQAQAEHAGLMGNIQDLQLQLQVARDQAHQQQQQPPPLAPEAEMQDAGPSAEVGDADRGQEQPRRRVLKAVRTTPPPAGSNDAGPSSGNAKSGGKHTPFSHEKEVHVASRATSTGKRQRVEDAQAHAASGGALQLPEGVTSVESMTVPKIKDWLTTEAKAEKEVYELDMKKGKKADFVKLAKQKLEESAGN